MATTGGDAISRVADNPGAARDDITIGRTVVLLFFAGTRPI